MRLRLLHWVETRTGFLVSVGAIALIAAALRLVRITFPPERVFDEVYSPVFAWALLRGEGFFDVHPILTELPHTIGLLLFGDTPLGWRFSPWLWGILFAIAAGLTAWLMTRRRLAGVLATLLVSLDTAMFIYGRTGLPDMFLLSQLALALALFFASTRIAHRGSATLAALGSGIFLGNVVATKWLGLAGIASVWTWLILNGLVRALGRRGRTTAPALLPNIRWWGVPVAFLFVPAFTYALWQLVLHGWPGSVAALWAESATWHRQVWDYHANLTAEHPYASPWWQWPVLRHPVLFYYEQDGAGTRVINATGNVVLWWAGAAALGAGIVSLFRRFQATVLWAVLSALFFWLPWAFISRVSFNYHYFASFFFEVLLLAMALTYLLDRPRGRVIAILFLLAAAGGFVALYPSATGLLPSFVG